MPLPFVSERSDYGSTCVLDLGLGVTQAYDFANLAGSLLRDWKLMGTTWVLASAASVRSKINALHDRGVCVIAGGTAGEIAWDAGSWEDYCAWSRSLGIDRVEIAEGFLATNVHAQRAVSVATRNGVSVQVEIGRKNIVEDAALSNADRAAFAAEWFEAGVRTFVIEAREVGSGYALFDELGNVSHDLISELSSVCGGIANLVVEAPRRVDYTAALRAFGPQINISNIYPQEFFRVEMMRRGLHADTLELRNWTHSTETVS